MHMQDEPKYREEQYFKLIVWKQVWYWDEDLQSVTLKRGKVYSSMCFRVSVGINL